MDAHAVTDGDPESSWTERRISRQNLGLTFLLAIAIGGGSDGSQRGNYHESIARLQQGTSAAATTLLKTMIDANTPASVKVRAAEAIFNHASKAIEIEDIEVRVEQLEAAAASS